MSVITEPVHYKWDYFTSLSEGPLRSRAVHFLSSVDWVALRAFATERRDGIPCAILPPIGLGYNHMVRIIEYEDGVRWVARLRLPSLTNDQEESVVSEVAMKREVTTISAVRHATHIPIPEVHAFKLKNELNVGAPFILMDCVKGNVGMDLSMEIPLLYRKGFLREMARIQVSMSKMQFPQIGTIIGINEDGTYQQGPIPGIGGPFDTATDYFIAWSMQAKFGIGEETLRKRSGLYAAEIVPSVLSFPKSVGALAKRLSVRDHGPFPLCHGDFGHNNTIVDDHYHVLAVIDWEFAFAGPLEIAGDYPLNISMMPRSIDAPWDCDQEGNPADPYIIEKLADQEAYLAFVKGEEENDGGYNYSLSNALQDHGRQELAAAIRYYEQGKPGFYSRLIDEYSSAWQITS